MPVDSVAVLERSYRLRAAFFRQRGEHALHRGAHLRRRGLRRGAAGRESEKQKDESARHTARTLANLQLFLADAQNFVGIALPPVELGEDLDLLEALVARGLDPGADQRQSDPPVPHHPAIVQRVARRHQPVADVVGQDALTRSSYLTLELRIPPHVVDVDGDAEPFPERVAQVEGLLERIDARALGGLHRVQRLDRERHAGFSCFGQDRRDSVFNLGSCTAKGFSPRRQAAHDQDQALRIQLVRLLDRAPVVVAPVLRREEAATAQAGHDEVFLPNRSLGFRKTHLCDLISPGRDAADAVARATLDDLREVPLLADRRGVEGEIHYSVPGGNSLGRKSGICGKTMIAASTSSIGTSMIITSFSASTMRILATAQAIIRHRPYGGVTRPKASDTMPTMAKGIGAMPTLRASGSSTVPTMTIAGMASRKQPPTRNTPAMKKPVAIGPMPHAATPSSSAFGIW